MEGLFVHIAHHQNAARGEVLNDGGDETVRFLKVQIHVAAIKKPAGPQVGTPAAGVLSNSISMKSGDHPSRAGMMVVMMPGNGGCSHKLPI
jgi:hypothetical protein